MRKYVNARSKNAREYNNWEIVNFAPRATVLLVLLFDVYVSLPSSLSIRARSSSLSASTSFGCPFFVGERVFSI